MERESDSNLMRAYARCRCEQSFAELAHRHMDFVYATALRILRDPGLAEDVTQRVFVALARNVAQLEHRSSLAGWLHETARNMAINTVRAEERRRRREQEAAAMRLAHSEEGHSASEQLILQLDEAISKLRSEEAELILMRFLERKTAEQIGAQIGLTPAAAQKRIARAMERLQGILEGQGTVVSVGSLSAALSAQAVISAPVGLAASVITTASHSAATIAASSPLHLLMLSTKAKVGIAALVAASAVTPIVLQYSANQRLKNENAALLQQAAEREGLYADLERLMQEARSAAEHRVRDQAEIERIRAALATVSQDGPEPRGDRAARVTSSVAHSSGGEHSSMSSAAKHLGRSAWTDAGMDTPQAALETLFWALRESDVTRIASIIRWDMQAIRKLLPAPEPDPVTGIATGAVRLNAIPEFVNSAATDMSLSTRGLASFRVLNASMNNPDRALLFYEAIFDDGSRATNAISNSHFGFRLPPDRHGRR